MAVTRSARSVLIVDDDSADCDRVAGFLSQRYKVVCAGSAADGLDALRAERPDCVLLAFSVMHADGLDAIARYTREGALVIVTMGRNHDALSAEAFKRGARDCVLTAGLTRPVLERIVEREIERRQLEIGLREAQELLQLAEKLEAIGQLAAGVAHEINTPAQYVSDNITFLSTSLAALAPVLEAFKRLASNDGTGRLRVLATSAELDYLLAEIPAAIESAAAGITQIKNIVNAMKQFSHPGEDLQLIDLNDAIRNTVVVARHEWKYVADVELDLAEDLPLIRCFPSQLNQVILNLVVNAAQAIGERAGNGAQKGTIRLSTRCGGADVAIAVADDGVGIPKEIRNKIFDPFFTTKEPGKGTGQGLAIVHRIVVEHHQGEIRVESEPGQGTTFEIRLPLGGAVCDEAAA